MTVAPDATVGDLQRALVDHAVARDVRVADGASLWTDAGPLQTVTGADGPQSGDRLWLSTYPPSGHVTVVSGAGDGGPVPLGSSVQDRTLAPVVAPPPERWWDRWLGRDPDLSGVRERLEDVRDAIEDEAAERHAAHPPVHTLLAGAVRRRRDDPDLLKVRLGTGTVPSRVRVEVGDSEHAGARALLEKIAAEAAVVPGAPVVLDLDADRAVGVVGDAGGVHGLVRSVLAQIAARHDAADVEIAALLTPASVRSFEWLRWLPHAQHLAASAAGADAIVTRLLERTDPFPRVVVIAEPGAVEPRALDRLALDMQAARIVWMGETQAPAPGWCRRTVAIDGDDLAPETVRVEDVDQLARRLAPERRSVHGPVGITDVLGGPPAPADVASAWSVSDAGFLDAPIGVAEDGTMSIDLVDAGPHALVTARSGRRHRRAVADVGGGAGRPPPTRAGGRPAPRYRSRTVGWGASAPCARRAGGTVAAAGLAAGRAGAPGRPAHQRPRGRPGGAGRDRPGRVSAPAARRRRRTVRRDGVGSRRRGRGRSRPGRPSRARHHRPRPGRRCRARRHRPAHRPPPGRPRHGRGAPVPGGVGDAAPPAWRRRPSAGRAARLRYRAADPGCTGPSTPSSRTCSARSVLAFERSGREKPAHLP